MNARISRRITDGLAWSPPLLRGLSWPGLAVVAGFITIWSLGTVVHPRVGVSATAATEFMVAWAAYAAVFLVGGLSVLLATVMALNLAGREAAGRFRFAILAGVLAAAIGALVTYLTDAIPFAHYDVTPWLLVATWLDWALLVAAGHLFVLRAETAREQAFESAARLKALEKERAEIRLRLLQAQIEPHFLFNTLSNIRRLCQTDRDSGRAMLGQFARYLQAAMPRIRRDLVSIGEEVELVEAYLSLQKIRMGERLHWVVNVPEADREALVPPMSLATLVENSIKHGLAPLVDGGSISVSSQRQDGRILLRVADTGRGFAASAGSGIGLANIRARLAALFGRQAALELQSNTPSGLVATIILPADAAGPVP